MIIDVNIRVRSNGKKITAIKALSQATGLGLTESKNIVEDADVSDRYASYRLNNSQFGMIAAYAATYNLDPSNNPEICFNSVKIVEPNASPMYDVSGYAPA